MAYGLDGKVYARQEDAPDMGSIVCVEVREGNIRSYEGLSADVAKLPVYDDLGTGSSCLFMDTGDYYKYDSNSHTWYKM